MSKISDRLTKLGQVERTGFGFGAHASGTKIPVILVGARIGGPADAAGLDADLVILAPAPDGAAQTTPLSEKDFDLWGVAVAGGNGDEIRPAVKAGADFIVVENESAPGAALNDDEIGRGFVVGSEITDDRARAIDSGPFDFLILDCTAIALPLNVGTALDIQEQLARYSRHIFLSLTAVPGAPDLEILRDMGVSALIYDFETTGKVDLTGLRKAIDKLEPKKHRSTAGAVLPHGGEPNSRSDTEYDDPEGDEDWD